MNAKVCSETWTLKSLPLWEGGHSSLVLYGLCWCGPCLSPGTSMSSLGSLSKSSSLFMAHPTLPDTVQDIPFLCAFVFSQE